MLKDHNPPLAHTALSEGLCISLRAPSGNGPYPTSRIQKGPVLMRGSTVLSGVGIGVGVPVAKFAHRVVFPGKAQVNEQRDDSHLSVWVVDYELNLEERVTLRSGKSIQNDIFYRLTEWFAGLHKAIPISRDLLEYGNRALRFTWRLSTTFETTPSAGSVRVSYTVDRLEGVLHVSVDASRLNKTGCTEMVLLNEQDGSLFDCYNDSNGLERFGKEIGTWEETGAEYVTLSDSSHNISLTLRRVAQSTMYRGREVAPGRLSWTGVAYVIPPRFVDFDYDIAIREAI
ncbi:MAG: hypothetical protein ACLQAL_09665 [Halobacteriota archaeon]